MKIPEVILKIVDKHPDLEGHFGSYKDAMRNIIWESRECDIRGILLAWERLRAEGDSLFSKVRELFKKGDLTEDDLTEIALFTAHADETIIDKIRENLENACKCKLR